MTSLIVQHISSRITRLLAEALMRKTPTFLLSSFPATLSLVATVLVALPAAAQNQYVYRNIDVNFPGSSNTGAGGINNAGTIVGSYIGADGNSHGFEDVNGTFTTIDFPTCPTSTCQNGAAGINNLGEIVGSFSDDNNIGHGYFEIKGAFQEIDFPGADETFPAAVNDKGVIVGSMQNSTGVHGFEFVNGQFSIVDCPNGNESFVNGINNAGDLVLSCGAAGSYEFAPARGFVPVVFPAAILGGTAANGINNLGDIIGSYIGNDGGRHGFLLSAGSPSTIEPMGSTFAVADGINDQGEITGFYNDNQNVAHGFLANGPELLDPVPDLMSGPAVASASLASVGLGGRVVKAVGADGVTEVVVRIPAQNVGDQFKLTLINDQNVPSTSPNNDGGLGNPGDTTFSSNQVTVTAIGVTTQGGGMAPLAFAVYRVPIDFARQNADGSYMSGFCTFITAPAGFAFESGAPSNVPQDIVGVKPIGDDQEGCRTVTISVQNLQTNTSSPLPVIILRPPVVLIHGLWDNWQTWNNFSPLVSGTGTVDSRFYIGRVSYDSLIGPEISASIPDYSSSILDQFFLTHKARANSLGFAFNAGVVQAFTDQWIEGFKGGKNPVGLPAAAVQADIVAHSMGGDIARTMVSQTGFLNDDNYDQGSIHKLITIDTPHLGSPLASKLLNNQESCLQHWVLAPFGDFVFSSVILGSPFPISGAIGDLSPSSQALANISAQGPHSIPTALIAATYGDFVSAQSSGRANTIFVICGNNSGSLAQDLVLDPANDWPAIFGEPSDAIVGLSSQLGGFSSSGFVFSGFLHSSGVKNLGFSGNTVLDPDSTTGIPSTVIRLLNTPVTDTASFEPVNP